MESRNVLVRKSVRYDVAIRSALRVAEVHKDLIKLSGASGAVEGWIACDCVDLSLGGAGFISPVFLPRNTRVDVHLFGASTEDDTVVLACKGVVRRVVMTDRRPAYHVGCVFESLHESTQVQVAELLAMVASELV